MNRLRKKTGKQSLAQSLLTSEITCCLVKIWIPSLLLYPPSLGRLNPNKNQYTQIRTSGNKDLKLCVLRDISSRYHAHWLACNDIKKN